MTLQLGILLALLCAVASNLSFFFKHRGACEAPAVDVKHPLRTAKALYSSRWFTIGMAVGGGAWGLHVAAISLVPLSVVQVVLSGGVVLIAVMADRIFGFEVGKRQWVGLACTAVLEHRIETNDAAYLDSGNVLLDRLLGCTIEYRPGGTDMQAAIGEVGARLASEGAKPYLIPGGGSNPTGALGYAAVALELVVQANELGLRIDRLVHATGSAGTQAGLVAGLHALSSPVRVLGIGVRAPKQTQEANVLRLARATAAHMGVDRPVPENAVEANCDYVGGGYGVPTPGMVEAVQMLARLEGIFLDPVYSGKGMAGLIDLIRRGAFSTRENVVFLHTGGSSGLFGYADVFNESA